MIFERPNDFKWRTRHSWAATSTRALAATRAFEHSQRAWQTNEIGPRERSPRARQRLSVLATQMPEALGHKNFRPWRIGIFVRLSFYRLLHRPQAGVAGVMPLCAYLVHLNLCSQFRVIILIYLGDFQTSFSRCVSTDVDPL